MREKKRRRGEGRARVFFFPSITRSFSFLPLMFMWTCELSLNGGLWRSQQRSQTGTNWMDCFWCASSCLCLTCAFEIHLRLSNQCHQVWAWPSGINPSPVTHTHTKRLGIVFFSRLPLSSYNRRRRCSWPPEQMMITHTHTTVLWLHQGLLFSPYCIH